MKPLTKEQRKMLHIKWQQNNQDLSYRQFRRTVISTFKMDDAIVVPWCDMFVVIEKDGYPHT